MYKKTCEKFMDMDKALALQFLEFNNFEAQRAAKPKHVKMLSHEMQTGKFLTGNVAFAFLKYKNDYKVMVNGQHQCFALIDSGVASVKIVYQEYECGNAFDLSDLYRRFDNHQSRSLSDVLNPEAAALGLNWKRRIVRLVVAAASLREGLAFSHKIDKILLLRRYISEGDFLDSLLKDGSSCKHLLRTPVIWAIIETFKRDPRLSELFWCQVRDGVGLREKSPSLLLRNYLMNSILSSSKGLSENINKTIVGHREIYSKSIHAWNAYRANRPTTLKYTPSAPLPKAV